MAGVKSKHKGNVTEGSEGMKEFVLIVVFIIGIAVGCASDESAKKKIRKLDKRLTDFERKFYGEIPEEEDCEKCSNIWYSGLNKRWGFYQSPTNISRKYIKLSVERGCCYIRKSSIGEIFKYQIIKLGRNI